MDAAAARLAARRRGGVDVQPTEGARWWGAELGGTGAQLATLAGEQEVALRNLLSGNVTTGPAARGTEVEFWVPRR